MIANKNISIKKPTSEDVLKVLIICYYWPPAGGPGVQRWLKFATYFKNFGIEPIIYTPKNPYYPIVDKNLIEEIPKDILVIKQPIKEPYGLAGFFSKKKTKQVSSGKITKKKQSLKEKVMLWVRGNLFIPDARVGWVKPSVKFLKNYCKSNKIDVVITTGPPHSMHLIGLELKKNLNITWLSDFRDPWTTIHYHKSLQLTTASKKKHKNLEAKILQSTDGVIVTSSLTKKEFKRITKKPIKVITNGFEVNHHISSSLDDAFTLVHIGTLLPERNPLLLWRVLSNICKTNTEFAKDFKLKLIGNVSNSILKSILDVGLLSYVENLGYVSHTQAIQYQYNAQVLLLIEMDSPETRCIIPGKLFEYLAAKRPIIAIGPEGSDIYSILYETQAGSFFTYQEEASLHQQVLSHYTAYKNKRLVVNSIDIERYNRKTLTQQMSLFIKTIYR